MALDRGRGGRRSRRWASGGSCSSTATTTTRSRSPTPARTRADRLPDGHARLPDQLLGRDDRRRGGRVLRPDDRAPREPGRDVGGDGDRPGLVDMDAANAEMPPFPEVTSPAARPHRVLLLVAGLGPPRDAIGDVGRRARGDGRVRRALPRGRDRGDDPDARRHRADVRGDADRAEPRAAACRRASATQVRRRRTITRAGRGRRRARRARRGRRAGPAAIRPRSVDPEQGERVAARGGDRGRQRHARRRRGSRTAVSRRDRPSPASVVVPASVTRPPATSTSSPPIAPRPSPVPATASASLTSSSRSGRLQAGDERPQRRVDVDAVGDQLDVGRRRRAARRRRRPARGGRRRSSR